MMSDLVATMISVFGFILVVMVSLYKCREPAERLPEDTVYNYEGNIANPKVNKILNRNAYLHTLAPSYRGAMYGLHNDRRKKCSSS